jgi:hypothetical protein
MPVAQPPDHVASFTEELLRTGLTFIDVSSDLIEGLAPEHFPGEDTGAVVVEMLTGTISTALAGTDEGDVVRATELIAAARERVYEHLRLALELSKRGRRPPGRTPGGQGGAAQLS